MSGGLAMYEGNKVILTAYKKEYLKLALQYFNDYDVAKGLVRGMPLPLREEDEQKFYDKIDPFSDRGYNFAILRKEDYLYIGGCGINKIDWNNSNCEVGIFLGKEFWNKGYGTDAMQVLIDFIFNNTSLNKIGLFVYEFNKRAIKSYEKCGFKIEGRLRENLFRDGRFYDTYVMGILRREWQPTK